MRIARPGHGRLASGGAHGEERVLCKVIPFRGELYAIGGCFGKDPYFTTVEKYSPETGRWTEVAFLPHYCLGMSVLVLPNNTFPALTI